MGMYTELHYNARLRRDVPDDIVAILRYMLGEADEPAVLPDDPPSRWRYLLTCDSYYFAADTHSTLRLDDIANQHFLCVRSNLKNYGGEIEWFIGWIDPYVEGIDGDFLGFYRYEETEDPTLIHKGAA